MILTILSFCYSFTVGYKNIMKKVLTLLFIPLLSVFGSLNFEKTKEIAEKGDAKAQFDLGNMHRKGEGILKDYKQAVYWFKKSAQQGDVKAQYNLATMYDNGEGVVKDQKQAIYWYTKSAQQGLAEAQFNLGNMHRKGEGVDQNYKQAVYWYSKSAEQGDATAQYNLGGMYAEGEGVLQDYIEAYAWINIAGANGFDASEARNFLSEKMTKEQIAKAQERSKLILGKIEAEKKQ
jgi:TPR repeat protein